MPWLSRNDSSVWVSTSTMALPIATTSKDLAGMGGLRRARAGPALLAHLAGTTGADTATVDQPSTRASGVGTLSRIPLPTPEQRRARRDLAHRHRSTRTAPTGCPARWCRRATTSSSSPTWWPSRSRGTCADRGRGRRGHPHRRLQRHRARGLGRVRRGRRPAPATRPRRSASTRSPSGSRSPSTPPSRPAPGCCTPSSPASSTTSSTASTAAPSPTTPASTRSSPPPSSRPPTPAGPSPAGTSPTSRPSSASPWWCRPS